MNILKEPIGKIAVFRALQLGDMLCVIPAVRALRNAYPHAEITLIGLPWACSFCERFNMYFDKFIHFPGYQGLPEQPFNYTEYANFVEMIRGKSFDLILQMQGNGTIVNEMIGNWGAAHIAGFRTKVLPAPSPFFIIYPERIHETRRHLALMQHLGITGDGEALEFPVSEDEENQVDTSTFPFLENKYVIIHPGSRGAYRQWPPSHFAEAAKVCNAGGYQVVLTGTADEHEIVERVIEHLHFPYYNTCGKTVLGVAALLIRKAALIVCNCTGVSHIASALKTPGVIISMDGEPERWGPLDKGLHTTINWLETPDLDNVLEAVASKLVPDPIEFNPSSMRLS